MGVESLSGWLLAIFRKRMDVLDQRVTQKYRQAGKRNRVHELRDRLTQTLSQEHFQLLLDWEAHMNERASEEREEWYLSGVSDGLTLSVSMDELSCSLLEDTPRDERS